MSLGRSISTPRDEQKRREKGEDKAYTEERASLVAQIKKLEEELLKHKKIGECFKEKEVSEKKDDIDSPRGAKEKEVVEEKDENKVSVV